MQVPFRGDHPIGVFLQEHAIRLLLVVELVEVVHHVPGSIQRSPHRGVEGRVPRNAPFVGEHIVQTDHVQMVQQVLDHLHRLAVEIMVVELEDRIADRASFAEAIKRLPVGFLGKIGFLAAPHRNRGLCFEERPEYRVLKFGVDALGVGFHHGRLRRPDRDHEVVVDVFGRHEGDSAGDEMLGEGRVVVVSNDAAPPAEIPGDRAVATLDHASAEGARRGGDRGVGIVERLPVQAFDLGDDRSGIMEAAEATEYPAVGVEDPEGRAFFTPADEIVFPTALVGDDRKRRDIIVSGEPVDDFGLPLDRRGDHANRPGVHPLHRFQFGEHPQRRVGVGRPHQEQGDSVIDRSQRDRTVFDRSQNVGLHRPDEPGRRRRRAGTTAGKQGAQRQHPEHPA